MGLSRSVTGGRDTPVTQARFQNGISSDALGRNGRRNRTQRVENPPETPLVPPLGRGGPSVERDRVSRSVTGASRSVTVGRTVGRTAGANLADYIVMGNLRLQ